MSRCLILFTTETMIYQKSAFVASNCNSITFINTGSDNVYVDNLLLQPGNDLSIEGERDEFNTKVYNVAFPAGALVAPSLTVIKKVYQ